MPKFLTNQNIELDIQVASVGDRILAHIIDILVIFGCSMLILFLNGFGADLGVFLLFIPLMFYTLLFEILSNGQTPGKRARNIRVVKVDGGQANLGQYVLRWMFRLIDIYTLYGAIGVIAISTSKNGQRLGDMAAGTTVIKIREASVHRVFTPEITPDYEIQFPNAKLLTDDQVDLMKKAIKMARENDNYSGVTKMAIKLKEKLQIESNLDDQQFIVTIIKDYEYMANE